MTTLASETTHLRFLFDPACPFAYRTSLWVRSVRELRPLAVEWDLYSLEYANRETADPQWLPVMQRSRPDLRLLHIARELYGNDALDRLYLALGRARHERGEELDDPETLRAALEEAGLDASLYEQALEKTELDDVLWRGYEERETTGAFGVPTLYFDGAGAPYYGPVLSEAPEGEEAVGLWDDLRSIAGRPYFYELKRPR